MGTLRQFWGVVISIFSIFPAGYLGPTPSEPGQMNLEILPLTAAEASSFHHKLPRLSHKDPFDRIIIWQAIQRKMILVSKDRDFKAYRKFGLRTFW